MRRTVGTACSALGLLLILAVVLVCLPLTAPRLMGYEVYAIVSGSMEPAISTGSLVYAKAAEPEDIAPGDVIVFWAGQPTRAAITHRVVENDAAAEQFITKGDANADSDVEPIPYTDLIGRVALDVPALGYFLPAVSTLEGKLSLLGVLAAAALLQALGSGLRRGGRENG